MGLFFFLSSTTACTASSSFDNVEEDQATAVGNGASNLSPLEAQRLFILIGISAAQAINNRKNTFHEDSVSWDKILDIDPSRIPGVADTAAYSVVRIAKRILEYIPNQDPSSVIAFATEWKSLLDIKTHPEIFASVEQLEPPIPSNDYIAKPTWDALLFAIQFAPGHIGSRMLEYALSPSGLDAYRYGNRPVSNLFDVYVSHLSQLDAVLSHPNGYRLIEVPAENPSQNTGYCKSIGLEDNQTQIDYSETPEALKKIGVFAFDASFDLSNTEATLVVKSMQALPLLSRKTIFGQGFLCRSAYLFGLCARERNLSRLYRHASFSNINYSAKLRRNCGTSVPHPGHGNGYPAYLFELNPFRCESGLSDDALWHNVAYRMNWIPK